MERLKKHSCPGAIVSSVIEFGNTDDSDKDVDNKENNDANKSKAAPPSLEWLQKTLRRSRSEYHQNNRSRTNFMSVQVKMLSAYMQSIP